MRATDRLQPLPSLRMQVNHCASLAAGYLVKGDACLVNRSGCSSDASALLGLARSFGLCQVRRATAAPACLPPSFHACQAGARLLVLHSSCQCGPPTPGQCRPAAAAACARMRRIHQARAAPPCMVVLIGGTPPGTGPSAAVRGAPHRRGAADPSTHPGWAESSERRCMRRAGTHAGRPRPS